MEDTPAPGPIGASAALGIRRLPSAPPFEGFVASGLAALDGVEGIMLSASDAIVHAGDSDPEADTAADAAALAILIGEIPETWSEPAHDALVADTDSFGGELAARAGELPAETAPPPVSDLPPPGDEFETNGDGGGGGVTPEPPFPPPDTIPATEAYWRARVRHWYLVVLQREPDEGGWAGWVSPLLVGRAVASVWADFLAAANTERAARGLPPY